MKDAGLTEQIRLLVEDIYQAGRKRCYVSTKACGEFIRTQLFGLPNGVLSTVRTSCCFYQAEWAARRELRRMSEGL